jgi:hypothetical protein
VVVTFFDALAKEPIMASKKKQTRNTRGMVTNPEMIIVKDIKTNPRKEGSLGWHSWSLIKSGMTVAKFVELGGRTSDLRYDMAQGHLHLTIKK